MAYLTVKALFTAINNSVRTKRGTALPIAHQDIPANIDAIVTGEGGADVSGVTATAGTVLAPEIFVNSSGVETEGTIPSKGAETITPTESAQEIAAGQYLSGKQTIAPIPSAYKDMTTTDVVAANLLNGVKAGNASGIITGDMPDKSSTTQDAVAEIDSTYIAMPIPANGYYNTVSKIRESFADIAALIGLTAGILLAGNTVLGIEGSGVGSNTDGISLINKSITNEAAERLLSGVTVIGTNAFNGCTVLTKVAIASGVTEIKYQAFTNCTNLLKIWIPASCVTISTAVNSYSPFLGCPNGLIIYCEAASKPAGFGLYYNYNGGMSLTVNFSTTLEAFNAL